MRNQKKEFQSNFTLQQYQQQENYDNLDHSPFRGATKKSKTPHPVGPGQNPCLQDFSPLKGRQDPNMASFARQHGQ